MNTKRMLRLIVVLSVVLIAAGALTAAIASPSTPLLAEAVAPQADNLNPPAPPIPLEAAGDDLASAMSESSVVADSPISPTEVVKLIFIHHSCGGNWLADADGGLGIALRDNNYYVSATNYGWEVEGDAIGDRTDIGHWWEWFRGPNSGDIVAALYDETGQNFGGFGSWSRLATDPGGENKIVMFKSCYPNSQLGGSLGDTIPPIGSNPLRAEGSGSEHHTVANAQGIYIDLLNYFSAHQDKLFIAVTAPPMVWDITPTQAANARDFNDWLVNDWLGTYEHNNVAVFDFFNVLTSNGGDSETNDVGSETGNHHRWWSDAVQHIQTVSNNIGAYGDDHPNSAGNQKATAEFVELLNVYYNRWRGGAAPSYTFNAVIAPSNATPPITYLWSPEPASGQGTASAAYQWDSTGVYEISVEATNCGGTFSDTHTITIGAASAPLAVASTDDAMAQTTVAFQDGVSPDASYAGTRDVIIANDEENIPPDQNLGHTDHLETFYGDSEHRRSLMYWDLSALPSDITVAAATVELYRYDGDASNPMQVALYRVTQEWAEGSGDFSPSPGGATWITATAGTVWTSPGGEYNTTALDQTTIPTSIGAAWIRLDATSAVQAWVDGSADNYGLLLRPLSGSSTYHYYHSREAITATLRPRLVVTYTSGTALALTAPAGSTRWPVSSTQQIEWTTTGGAVAQVNVYYSSDSFVTSDTIASEIANTGSCDWTTPPTATASARVRVESVISPTTIYDVSDEFALCDTLSVYLPLVMRNYVSCTSLTGVTISGPTSGTTGVAAPSQATKPDGYPELHTPTNLTVSHRRRWRGKGIVR